MKKIFTILALALLSVNVNAQADSAKIIKHVDDMSEDFSIMASRTIILINDDNSAGFSIMLTFKEEEGKIIQDGLMCKLVGLGDCVENVEMIIMFTDSSKVTLKSWNKFNCDGNAYFNIKPSEEKQLRTKQLLKMRMTNGSSYESLTVDAHDTENDYFINLLAKAEKNLIEIRKE